MSELTKRELEIILGYYIFEGHRSNHDLVTKFTDKFNLYFSRDISPQKISFILSNYKNIDSSFTVPAVIPNNHLISELWNYYIENDRQEELKASYNVFKINEFASIEDNLISNYDSLKELINENILSFQLTFIDDKVKKPYYKEFKEGKQKVRDANVVMNALIIANYKCEYDRSHNSFIRKNGNFNYTEGHHLIPLEFQNQFEVNLDVEGNVVSLCSHCHNNIHYGRDYLEILKSLYMERKNRLKKCGINVKFEELAEMYKKKGIL